MRGRKPPTSFRVEPVDTHSPEQALDRLSCLVKENLDEGYVTLLTKGSFGSTQRSRDRAKALLEVVSILKPFTSAHVIIILKASCLGGKWCLS